MKVSIQKIMEGFEFQGDESDSYLNKKTGEICTFTHEELRDAESGDDLSDYPEWQQEAVARAKEFLGNEKDYISLPTKFDFHEYRVMERFISGVPVPEQAEELICAIKGRGAFRMFKDTARRFGLLDQWYAYRDEAIRELVVDWCETHGIPTDTPK